MAGCDRLRTLDQPRHRAPPKRARAVAAENGKGTLALGFYYTHFPTSGHFTKQPSPNSRDQPQTGGALVKNRKFTLVTDHLALSPALWQKRLTSVLQEDPRTVVFAAGSETVRVELRGESSTLTMKAGCNRVSVEGSRVHISMGSINGASRRGEVATVCVTSLMNGQAMQAVPLQLQIEIQAKQTSYHLKVRGGAAKHHARLQLQLLQREHQLREQREREAVLLDAWLPSVLDVVDLSPGSLVFLDGLLANADSVLDPFESIGSDCSSLFSSSPEL